MNIIKKHWNTLERNEIFRKLVESAFLMVNSDINHLSMHREFVEDFPNQNFKNVYERVKYYYFSSRCFQDKDVLGFLKKLNVTAHTGYNNLGLLTQFNNVSKEWISKNYYIDLDIPDQYNCYPMQSTITCIENFMLRHNGKTVRTFGTDYWNKNFYFNLNVKYKIIDDTNLDIDCNDIVIITLPSHSTHEIDILKLEKLFAICEEKQVPIFIDAIWLFLYTKKISINLNYSCIEEINISLSKLFPISNIRCGIRLINSDTFSNWDYRYKIPRLDAELLIKIMKNFRSDYIVEKYIPKQLEWCKRLDIIPSNLVTSGYCPIECELLSENILFNDIQENTRYLNLVNLIDHEKIIFDYGIF